VYGNTGSHELQELRGNIGKKYTTYAKTQKSHVKRIKTPTLTLNPNAKP